MNENLDLTQVLKNYPKGGKLYSPIFGEVEFEEITPTGRITINPKGVDENLSFFVCRDGKAYDFAKNGEVMLFPSKDQRDWSKFNPNAKPIFKVGDRIVDTVRNNGYVYEILDVQEDRYKVTGFDTLWFWEQNDFALAPVQIEFVEPQKLYWFVCRGESTEPLLEKLLELTDSAYKPVNMQNDDLVYNNGNEIIIARGASLRAALVREIGIELRIKEM